MDFIILIIIKPASVNDQDLEISCELVKFLYVKSQLCQCFDLFIKNSCLDVPYFSKFHGSLSSKRKKWVDI